MLSCVVEEHAHRPEEVQKNGSPPGEAVAGGQGKQIHMAESQDITHFQNSRELTRVKSVG